MLVGSQVDFENQQEPLQSAVDLILDPHDKARHRNEVFFMQNELTLEDGKLGMFEKDSDP